MTDRREYIAYHEAGHAVACCALHRPFDYVTLLEDQYGERLGHFPHPASYRWQFDYFLNVDAASWDSALNAIVGPAAEYRRMTGNDDWGGFRDYLEAQSAREDGPDPDQLVAQNYLMLQSKERNLWHVKEVRESLFSLCVESALALVDEYWDSITAVAQALLEKETLSCSETRELSADAREKQKNR